MNCPQRCAGSIRIAVAALAGTLLAVVAIAGAEPASSLVDGRVGRIEFGSATPGGPTQLVQRTHSSEGTVVAGELTLPTGMDGLVAAMVVAHGSGGLLPGREDAWARRLNAAGMAAFVVDSFGPRGLKSTATDQSRLSTMANLADALAALR